MIRRFVLALFALSPVVPGYAAQRHAEKTQPAYTPVTLCEISFHRERANPKLISVRAELVNAFPHGLVLLDPQCPHKGLQIDFPDNGLDPTVAFINDHIFQIHRAEGTFRGMLKRDPSNGRLLLWLQSVANFQSDDLPPEAVRLPAPQFPPTLPSVLSANPK